MPTANQSKPTSDKAGKAEQLTMGDVVPEEERELEELVGRYQQAKIAVEKSNEKLKAVKADIRDAMVERELSVYHARSAPLKISAKEELTVRVVKDTPDGDEG